MSDESWGQEGTAVFAGQPAANDAVTAGALLRRAREAAGLHVAALAVSLKVPVRKLEALEEDRWDVFPDAVFVRALACSVCRTLKIDAQPVLQRLPQSATPRLAQLDQGLNTPFRAPGDGAAPNWRDLLTRPVFLTVFALLLGALVLILLPNVRHEESVAAAPATGGAGRPGAVSGAKAPAVQTASADGALLPAAAASSPPIADAPASGIVAAAAVQPAAPAAAATADPVAGAASGVIVFRTTGQSWIEVTDAQGAVTVRRLLAAGESTAASGPLPLQVVVGRADATQVQVRGKPFDLRPLSRDNVARFEVK